MNSTAKAIPFMGAGVRSVAKLSNTLAISLLIAGCHYGTNDIRPLPAGTVNTNDFSPVLRMKPKVDLPPMPISAPAVKRTSAVAAAAAKPRDAYLPLLLPTRTNGYWAIAARKNSGPWYYPPGWHSCPAWYRPEGWVNVTNDKAPGLMQYRAQWHKELWP